MINRFLTFLPVQLFLNHLKKNHLLLLIWVVLFATVTENLGKVFGVPYLLLDPEYLHATGFQSFFIMGICIAGFIMSYQITSYILDSHAFSFLGTLPHPFAKYSLNNALIPLAFLITYTYKIIEFQVENEYNTPLLIFEKLSGFFLGFILLFALWTIYFRFTNTDIFLLIASNLDKGLKKMPVTRHKALEKLDIARRHDYQVNSYLDLNFKVKELNDRQTLYDKKSILRVFDQNHLNSVITGLILIALTLILGVFREYPVFQIPAGASSVLFLTIFILFSGALIYWLRGWSTFVTIMILIAVNLLFTTGLFHRDHKAYGLDYDAPPQEYSLKNLEKVNSAVYYQKDFENTLQILKNWRAKFPEDEKPHMVIVCTSGGGQRSALWTMKVLQTLDSLTEGQFFEQTMLMTGASGGLIGAGYYRELKLRQITGDLENPYNPVYLKKISNDNLNPVVFTFISNDLFIPNQYFHFAGHKYVKDRGYTFEEQLNKNTDYFMNRKLWEYREPEAKAQIPMMIISPTIINDGRKLFISPHHVSYMASAPIDQSRFMQKKFKGIDFRRFFNEHGADSLRFLSALRMSATFPYFTPNVTLPCNPPIQIMDAGIADNFGISTGVHFLHTFKEWINDNTAGVVFVSIRDSQKNKPIEKELKYSLFNSMFTPLRSLYRNWLNLQDLNNDHTIELANSWFEGDINRIELEYVPTTIFKEEDLPSTMPPDQQQKKKEIERASLSWHLTTREKENIRQNIYLEENQEAIRRLKDLLLNKERNIQVSNKPLN